MNEAKKAEKLSFVSPAKVLKEIGLKEGDTVIDYGSGSGHWAIAAAGLVAPKGIVYALEENIEILQLLKNLAVIKNIVNIEIEEVDIEKGVPKVEAKAELIIIANTLHSVKNRKGLFERSYDLIKEDGKVLVIDWSNNENLFGPHEKHRLVQEDVMTQAENVGFKFVCTVDAGWHHFGMVFKKDK